VLGAPHHVTDAHAAALVEGTLLAAYEFRTYKGTGEDDDRPAIRELVVSAHHDVADPRRRRARGPPPPPTPRATCRTRRRTTWGRRRSPTAPASIEGAQVEVLGRADIVAAGMGAFAAVARAPTPSPR
jgi:leucyl aminopeptidase